MQCNYTEFPTNWDKAEDSPIQRDQRNGDKLVEF